MRRLNLVLLAAFQLCGARTPGFSIHEDLLTYPQFEVEFSNDFISEKDAEALLERNHPTYSAGFAQSTLDNIREAGDDETNGEETDTPHTYEVVKLPPHQYLCSIPVLQPQAPENKTANDLAKAEEAKELSRATSNGWELLNQLEDTCLYFMSGWWSYSFCNNHEIVQFHALPSMPNGQPPRQDPNTAKFTLGRTPTIPPSANYQARREGGQALPAELQVKGDQRYLVQRLEGGTICDLTGRDRTIEVQYHCVPGMKGDRIGWIKEVTICAYLMVVNTPRLCDDIAFLPPQETRANSITCRLISDGDATPPPLLDQAQTPNEPVQGQAEGGLMGESQQQQEVTVGGVVVGARHVLSGADEVGKPPAKLSPPQSYFGSKGKPAERVLETIAQGEAKDKGGKVTMLSDEELDKLDLDRTVVQEMSKELQEMAGNKGWTLELVELPAGEMRELRGYIDEDGKKGSQGSQGRTEAQEGTNKDTNKGTNEDTNEKTEGSEEKFKDEL
ncbi:Fc.00g031640.m01.CDS01 [Cosmosporella sp. VM-42]